MFTNYTCSAFGDIFCEVGAHERQNNASEVLLNFFFVVEDIADENGETYTKQSISILQAVYLMIEKRKKEFKRIFQKIMI